MSKSVAFSILMPCFNPDPYIDEAVESALSQMTDADELLIQDGGSTDGSIERLRERYAADARVKIVSARDEGQADALQKASERAANPYLGWLNADDVYYPGALDVARRTFAEHPDADVVYGSATVFDNSGRILRRGEPGEFTVRSFVRNGCHMFSGAAFFRASKVAEAGGWDKSLKYTMDFDLYFRLAEHGAVGVRVPEQLGGLRYHEASKTGSASRKFIPEAARIRLVRAETPGDRLRIYSQIGFRAAMLPLTPLRHSKAVSALRGTKKFRD